MAEAEAQDMADSQGNDAGNSEVAPAHWEQSLDKSKLQVQASVPFCCLLRSQGQRNVSIPSDDPKKEAESKPVTLTQYLTSAIKNLPRRHLMLLEPEALAQQIIDAASAEEEPVVPEAGSLAAAVVEAGIENLTPELKAALVHQRLIADTGLSEQELAAADIPPVEDPEDEQPADDAAEPDPEAAEAEAAAAEEPDGCEVVAEELSGRAYVFVGWPNTVEDIQALAARGLYIQGAFELQNPPGYVVEQEAADTDTESAAAVPMEQDQLLCAIREIAAGPVREENALMSDFVWVTVEVPAPIEQESADEGAPAAPDAPALAAASLKEKVQQLRDDVAEFRLMVESRPLHKIPPLDPHYDSGLYHRTTAAIPPQEISVPLLLDLIFEQVALNAEQHEPAPTQTQVKQQQLQMVMDQSELQLFGSSTPPTTQAGQLVTLLRFGDDLGRSDAMEPTPAREAMEASTNRLRAQLQLPGAQLQKVFPAKRLTEQQRGARRTELYEAMHGVELSSVAVERALMVNEFEKLLSLPQRSLGDRTVVECFGPDTMSQVVATAAGGVDVHAHTKHYADHNVCLLGLTSRTPAERLDESRRSSQLPLRPRCAQWLTSARDGASKGVLPLVAAADIPEVPESFVEARTIVDGALCANQRILYPRDGAAVVVDECNQDCTMYHKEVTCGLRRGDSSSDASVFFGAFKDKSRLCAALDVATEECKLQLSHPSGLIVVLSSLGRIYQRFEGVDCNKKAGAESVATAFAEPVQRVVLADGTVVLQEQDDSVKLLFANGNVSRTTAGGLWVSTNTLGARMSVTSGGVEGYMPPIMVSDHIDFETQAQVQSRSDGTVIVKHTDGTQVVKHADGTVITTSKVDIDHHMADTITVQATNYGTVVVKPATGQLEIDLPEFGSFLSLCTDAKSPCATIQKRLGEVVQCQLAFDFSSQLVTVNGSIESLLPNGTIHKFDTTSGAYSCVDSARTTFRSARDQAGAALDEYVDPASIQAELDADKAATVAERVMVVGTPASGKSTVCQHLAERYGHEIILVEPLLESLLAVQAPEEGWPEEGSLEKEAHELKEAEGGLGLATTSNAASQLRVKLLERHLATLSGKRWVLDGFPSTDAEASALQQRGLIAQRVLLMKCSEAECTARQPESPDISEAYAHFTEHVIDLKNRYEFVFDVIDTQPVQPSREQRIEAMKKQAKLAIRASSWPAFKMQVAVTGLPGAGCSTQASALSAKYGCVVLRLSELVAAAGQDAATLTPDIEAELFQKATQANKCQVFGFVIAGWPRTSEQVKAAASSGIVMQKVLVLGELDPDVAFKRLVSRAEASGAEPDEVGLRTRIDTYEEGKTALLECAASEPSISVVAVDASTLPEGAVVEEAADEPVKKGKGAPAAEVPTATVGHVTDRLVEQVRAALLQASTSHLPRIFCLGPSGSGKTTQCEQLAQAAKCVHVCIKELARAAIVYQNEAGLKIHQFYADGGTCATIPDELIVPLVVERLAKQDCASSGWVLDGFPTSVAQAEALEAAGVVPKQVVMLQVDAQVAVNRVTGRRFDSTSQKLYHAELNKPETLEMYEAMECMPDEQSQSAAVAAIEANLKDVESLQQRYEQTGVLSCVDALGEIATIQEGFKSAVLLPAADDAVMALATPGNTLDDFRDLRLFVVHEDGSGLELVTPGSVESFITSKQSDAGSEVIQEPQPGDEQASTWLASFTKRAIANAGEPADCTGLLLPKVLKHKSTTKAASTIYEYRHLVQSNKIHTADYDLVLQAQSQVESGDQARSEAANKYSVPDTRTTTQRDLEIAIAARVSAVLLAEGRERLVVNNLGDTMPGAPAPRVTFNLKPPKGSKPGGTGRGSRLRPTNFGSEGNDATQYPDPSSSSHNEEFRTQNSPVALFEDQNAGAAAPPAPAESLNPETDPHVLDEPLPHLSNTQVVDPMESSHLGAHNLAASDPLPPISSEWPIYCGRDAGIAPPLNINGEPRKNPVQIPKTLKMRPAGEANEKFNRVEEPVRRSMRTGASLNLSMSGVGVEGRDPSRGFLCRPELIDYGNVQAGVKYGAAVTIMNGGIDGSRFQVKKPKTCVLKYKTGMVAPGVSVRIQVHFCCAEPGVVQQELQITTESDVFRIPIRANVLTAEGHAELGAHERSKAMIVL